MLVLDEERSIHTTKSATHVFSWQYIRAQALPVQKENLPMENNRLILYLSALSIWADVSLWTLLTLQLSLQWILPRTTAPLHTSEWITRVATWTGAAPSSALQAEIAIGTNLQWDNKEHQIHRSRFFAWIMSRSIFRQPQLKGQKKGSFLANHSCELPACVFYYQWCEQCMEGVWLAVCLGEQTVFSEPHQSQTHCRNFLKKFKADCKIWEEAWNQMT